MVCRLKTGKPQKRVVFLLLPFNPTPQNGGLKQSHAPIAFCSTTPSPPKKGYCVKEGTAPHLVVGFFPFLVWYVGQARPLPHQLARHGVCAAQRPHPGKDAGTGRWVFPWLKHRFGSCFQADFPWPLCLVVRSHSEFPFVRFLRESVGNCVAGPAFQAKPAPAIAEIAGPSRRRGRAFAGWVGPLGPGQLAACPSRAPRARAAPWPSPRAPWAAAAARWAERRGRWR